MKQFLLHLDETNALGTRFIIQDLDSTHLFISSDIIDSLKNQIDDLMDQISFSSNIRQQYRVLDESGRNRRRRNQLEQLERDNFHDDPHANLQMHKKAPKFEDNHKSNSHSVWSSTATKRH
ncbi:unnamed protein product, partial [Medioppia subpectinata]